MDRNTKDWMLFGIVLSLAFFPAMSLYALSSWSDDQLEREWPGLFLIALPGTGLLYWPIRWQLAHLKRTAPEREEWRQAVRHEAIEAAAARKARRDEQEQRRRDRLNAERERRRVAQAIQHVRTFFARHEALLADALPETLFAANVEASFPDDIGVSKAWEVARDMIADMQAMAQQGRVRLRETRKRLDARKVEARAKDTEIRKCEREIARLRVVGRPDDGYSADEIEQLQAQIATLQQERAALLQVEEA